MNNEKRMYILVPYNLSGIQKGIQALHGVVEYELMSRSDKCQRKKYNEWAEQYKTVILLNGGTTGKLSSMSEHRYNLQKLGVHFSIFREPDLNDAITAIAFVLDMVRDSQIIGYLKQMGLA